jgi:exodeoxyribonuclease-3
MNKLKIATWNVNSLKVRLPQVLEWLDKTKCDVLALQELKLENHAFPLEAFTSLGFNCIFNGQKTYNGVAIISKEPLTEVCSDIPNYAIDIQKRVISATLNGIRIICVYVVNGASLDSEKYKYKLEWLKELNYYLTNTLKKYPNLVVLGDFNIAPEPQDVYGEEGLKEQILCSTGEREAWHKLLENGLHDSFRVIHPTATTYTWWDYRNFAFKRNQGFRIDHILVSSPLLPHLENCSIDLEPRKHERPSDHAPLILEVNLN